MFHYLSPLLWSVIRPSELFWRLGIVGVVLMAWSGSRTFGRRLAAGSALLFFVFGLVPVGDLLIDALQFRYATFQVDGKPVTGVIVLGGSIGYTHDGQSLRPKPKDSGDRIFEAARLAKLYPAVPVVVSGGPIMPPTGRAEADDVARYLVELGVDLSRIVKERQSADTFENARFSAKIVNPKPTQRWLLVTSAFHMPRAMASFRAAGFNVYPAPCDWRGDLSEWPRKATFVDNLQSLDVAVREVAGYVVYALSGRFSRSPVV